VKRFEELNYYELLDIPNNASFSEIRQAYREAFSIYNEDSLITYSFFTDDERDGILRKIEEAFLTLIDEKKRAGYNRIMVNAGVVDASTLTKRDEKKIIPLFQRNKKNGENVYSKIIRKKIAEKDVKEISHEILSKELISGDDLKNLRKLIGVELEEVFEVVRISVPILKSIEDNEFESLPPTIYLKNFLRSYAEILQLDSEKVVDGYIRNMTNDEITL
jgi:hypothetical protein